MRLLARLLPVLALLLAGCATTAPQSDTAAALAPAQRQFPWEAVPPEGGEPVMLVGSVHLGRTGALPLGPEIEAAFERATGLVVELDTGKHSDPAVMQPIVMRYGITPEGETLFTRLTPETADAVRAALARRGIPEPAVSRMRPWLVGITLGVAELQAIGWDAEGGIDKRLLDRARGMKEIVELETVEQQMAVLSTFEGDEEELLLRATVRDLEHVAAVAEAIEVAWRNGDTEAMARLSRQSSIEDARLAPYFDRLLDGRNVGMAEKIAALPREGRWLVAVGAGHLVGEKSIPALLAAKGWKVRQIER